MSTKQSIQEILKRYPELPSHYIIRLLGKSDKSKGGYPKVNMLKNLNELKEEGLIWRFSPTNDHGLKVSKHASFSLHAPGFRDRTTRPHRLLESVTQADTEIGVRADADYDYISFADFAAKPNVLPRALLDIIDRGGDPHLIPLKDGHVHPDGSPFCVVSKKTDQYVNYIDEVDRDTQPLTTTKVRRNIETKWEYYHEFFQRKLWASHYGFKNCILRFFTINESRMHAAMRLYENKYGKCSFILFATTKDWINEVSYPREGEVGETFRQKYLRIGHEPYWMSKV